MTPLPVRNRPRRATAHRSVRVAHALVGGAAGVMWLVLPLTAARGGPPAVPAGPAGAAASTPARDRAGGGAPSADLVLPLVTAGTVCVLAGYGRVRRLRRARTRTTPGATPTGARDDLPGCAGPPAADRPAPSRGATGG
ncbi:hypothetical protein [Streptomyces sp. AD55]|uniref:hypothetical protein n=1 Tax=Streptomyces sp. AD55 TaxID=3242895 RepID=UPI00352771BD